MSVTGLAVVVTLIGPTDVITVAVIEIGFQTIFGTQYQVGILTTIFVCEGAVRVSNIGTNSLTRLWECSAIRRDVSSLIQWYVETVPRQPRWYRVSVCVATVRVGGEVGDVPAVGLLTGALLHLHTEPADPPEDVSGARSKRTWASMLSPVIDPEPSGLADAWPGSLITPIMLVISTEQITTK